MKKSLLSLAAVALVSGAAFAGEADPAGQFALQIAGQRTRADVNAEAVDAIGGVGRYASRPALGEKLLASQLPTLADIVLNAIRDEQFWILTHDDYDSSIRARMEGILNRTNPVEPENQLPR